MAESGRPEPARGRARRLARRRGRERENLRAALAWSGEGETGLRLAAALAPFWIAHGLIGEGRRSLAAVLAGSGEPSVGRARALSVAGFLAAAGRRSRGRRARVPREPGAVARRRGVVPRVALNVLGTVPAIATGGTRPAAVRRGARARPAGPLVAGGARAREPRRPCQLEGRHAEAVRAPRAGRRHRA